ncbi:hypothetical protein ACFOGJ_24135 [Marinibaculum pumilum]|uniref:PIN domain-containing protein n=1 Tax=Marinibaculum pumilum TaxID=1766165 RepID=A0ABV7L733_9PROT
MRVLVSDTSILIDLERGELLETAFRLSFELAVPDVLFRRELEPFGGSKFPSLGLRVEELDAVGVQHAQAYRQRVPRLSIPDTFAITLAQRNSWLLLTGDQALRKLAESEQIDCHGLLWFLDLMFEEGVNGQRLFNGLRAISSHPRCRLPIREVKARLQRYRR